MILFFIVGETFFVPLALNQSCIKIYFFWRIMGAILMVMSSQLKSSKMYHCSNFEFNGAVRSQSSTCCYVWAVMRRVKLWPNQSAIFSSDQAALRTLQSIRPSVICPSFTPLSLCSHHCIIIKFSGVITNGRNDVHAKVEGQRSKVKVTEVKTWFSRFRTGTPVWIHIWVFKDTQSLK